MSLKPYDVVDENGNATTLLLSEEDAKARGLVKPAAKKASEPAAKKAATPANKAVSSPSNK